MSKRKYYDAIADMSRGPWIFEESGDESLASITVKLVDWSGRYSIVDDIAKQNARGIVYLRNTADEFMGVYHKLHDLTKELMECMPEMEKTEAQDFPYAGLRTELQDALRAIKKLEDKFGEIP